MAQQFGPDQDPFAAQAAALEELEKQNQGWMEWTAGLGRDIGVMARTAGTFQEQTGTRAVMVQGTLDRAILQPLHGLSDLMARGNEKLGYEDTISRAVTNYLDSFRTGFRNRAEEYAEGMGVDSTLISRGRLTGDMIGYMVPATASFKLLAWGGNLARATSIAATTGDAVAASAALRAPVGSFLSNLTLDVASGAITGGILTPGDMQERKKNAMHEAALNGAFNIVLGAVTAPFLGFRAHNQYMHSVDKNLRGRSVANLTEVRYGQGTPPATPEEAAAYVGMLNDEQWIINSPSAQRIIQLDMDRRALVQAIAEATGARANSGIVRTLAAENLDDAGDVLDSLQKQFPGLHFQLVKRSGGEVRPDGTRFVERTVGRQVEPVQTVAGTQGVKTEEVFPDSPTPDPDQITEAVFVDGKLEFSARRSEAINDTVYQNTTGRLDSEPGMNVIWNDAEGAYNVYLTHGTTLTPRMKALLRKSGFRGRMVVWEAIDKGFTGGSGFDARGEFTIAPDVKPKRILKKDQKAPRAAVTTGDVTIHPRATEVRVQRMVEEPAIVKGPAVYDVYFGTKPLRPRQLAQFKREGRYEGQTVVHASGATLEYVGRAKPGYVRVKRTDNGKIVTVKESKISDQPFGTPPDERAPHIDALFRNFEEWASTRLRDVLKRRSEPTSEQIKAGAEGVDLDQLRDFGDSQAVEFPEEVGIPNNPQAQAKTRMSELEAEVQEIAKQTQGIPPAQYPPEIGERLKAIQQEYMQLKEALESSVADLAARGKEAATPRAPQEAFSFEDLFDIWAREMGLSGEYFPTEGVRKVGDEPLGSAAASWTFRLRDTLLLRTKATTNYPHGGDPVTTGHGTPFSFEHIDEGKLDPHSLYGPGYYTTELYKGPDTPVAGYLFKGEHAIANIDTLDIELRSAQADAKTKRDLVTEIQGYLDQAHAGDESGLPLAQRLLDGFGYSNPTAASLTGTPADISLRLRNLKEDVARVEARIPDLQKRLDDAIKQPHGQNIRVQRLIITNPLDIDRSMPVAKVRDFLAPLITRGYFTQADLDRWLSSTYAMGTGHATDISLYTPGEIQGHAIYEFLQNQAGAYNNNVAFSPTPPRSTVKEWLEELGIDGITHQGGGRSSMDFHRVWIAFRPQQVVDAFGDLEKIIHAAGGRPRTIPGVDRGINPKRAELEKEIKDLSGMQVHMEGRIADMEERLKSVKEDWRKNPSTSLRDLATEYAEKLTTLKTRRRKFERLLKQTEAELAAQPERLTGPERKLAPGEIAEEGVLPRVVGGPTTRTLDARDASKPRPNPDFVAHKTRLSQAESLAEQAEESVQYYQEQVARVKEYLQSSGRTDEATLRTLDDYESDLRSARARQDEVERVLAEVKAEPVPAETITGARLPNPKVKALRKQIDAVNLKYNETLRTLNQERDHLARTDPSAPGYGTVKGWVDEREAELLRIEADRGALLDLFRSEPEFVDIDIKQPTTPVTITKNFKSPQLAKPADLDAARVAFAQRMRTQLMTQLDPAEREVYDQLVDEWTRVYESMPDSLERDAWHKGMAVYRHPTGTIVVRDINTGATLEFASEESAKRGLREMMVDKTPRATGGGGSGSDGGLPPDMFSAPGPGAGGDGKADPDMFAWGDTLPDNLFTQQFVDSVPSGVFKSTREWFKLFEDMSGIPLFTRVFDRLMESRAAMQIEHAPWARRITQVWSGMKKADRILISKWWRAVEGTEMDVSEKLRLGRAMGLTPKHFAAARQAKETWDIAFQESGFATDSYLQDYFSKIPQWAESHNGVIDFRQAFGGKVPDHVTWLQTLHRTGEMANLEIDPLIVMHKWFRAWQFRKHMEPSWKEVARFAGTDKFDPANPNPRGNYGLRFKELPEAQQARMVALAGGRAIHPDSPVLPEHLRAGVIDFLAAMRGIPQAGKGTLSQIFNRMLGRLKVKAAPELLDEYINIGQSMMYGSAMGARPQLIARNYVEQLWWGYTRMGGQFHNSSLSKAQTREGFWEALDAGAIRIHEGGIAMRDVFMEQMMEAAPVGEGGLGSHMIAAGLRQGLRFGNLARKTADKFMIPYASMDEFQRAWGYHWTKQFTDFHLGIFERGNYTQDEFLEKGLPYFSQSIKKEFMDRLRLQGREEALRFIGRQGSDEAHFIYAAGAQPAYLQTTAGRLLGMFGSWPMWAKDMFISISRNATMKQKAAFGMRIGILSAATAIIGTEAGINMWNWLTPTGIPYAGGPAVDYLYDIRQIITEPYDRKAAALKRFGKDLGMLAFPGQVFFRDIAAASEAFEDPRQQFISVMLGRPTRDHIAMKWYLDEASAPKALSPERAAEVEDRDTLRSSFNFGPAFNIGVGAEVQGSRKEQGQVFSALRDRLPDSISLPQP